MCLGNYEGPHNLDVPLEEILPIIYKADVGRSRRLDGQCAARSRTPGVSSECLSPIRWPSSHGVIDTTSNYVEHEEVVADRIERAAQSVGDPRRIIAGTDCGFDTSAGLGDVAPSLVWEKLRALRSGADIATARLF